MKTQLSVFEDGSPHTVILRNKSPSLPSWSVSDRICALSHNLLQWEKGDRLRWMRCSQYPTPSPITNRAILCHPERSRRISKKPTQRLALYPSAPPSVILRSDSDEESLKSNGYAKVGYRRRIKRKTRFASKSPNNDVGLRPTPHQRFSTFGNRQGNDSLDPNLPTATPTLSF